jgi:RNA polymerase sigma factor (sigma-70 family)
MDHTETETRPSFDKIYSSYSDKAYALAFRMIGDSELAYDIVQEAFIAIYNNLSKFRGESSISTWIYAIVKNTCLRHLKKIRKTSFSSIKKLIDTVSSPTSTDDFTGMEKRFYIDQVKNGCLLGLLRCLPFSQRMAFILNLLFDLPIEEVATAIEKSPNASRILVMRARRKIKRFLCENCSLYDKANTCQCENLVSFSLKQGWLEKYQSSVAPARIESEIRVFKDEIALLKTLPEIKADIDITPILQSAATNQRVNIFSKRKVK